MTIKNIPAFPSQTAPSMQGCWGMTLRDYFAAAALPSVIAHWEKSLASDGVSICLMHGVEGGELEGIAVDCYSVADAMLRERESWK